MSWFKPKRYTVTDEELKFLLAIGELKGSVELMAERMDRLKKENAELRARLATSEEGRGD